MEKDNGHLLVPVLRRSGALSVKDSPQGIWDKIAEKDVVGIRRKRVSDFPNSEVKDMENCRFTLVPLNKQLRLFFAYSFLQLSLYGAVAEMCEEYESLHDRSGRPDMVMGQSIALSAIKTEVSLNCDDSTNQNLLLENDLKNDLKSCHNKIN